MNIDDKDDHKAAFIDSIKDAIPLHTDKAPHYSPKMHPHPAQSYADEARVMQEILDWDYGYEHQEPDDTLTFCRPGVQKTVFRKLRRGQYKISHELDLHGMTLAEAGLILPVFLLESRQQDLRCVRIIHGKGISSSNRGPVIKPMVNRWLRRKDEVLAFCSARPADGGAGAVYVLLKRL